MDAVCKGERTPMKEYVVEAVAENLTKSVFMATRKPILTVPNGAVVQIETINTDIAVLEKRTAGNLSCEAWEPYSIRDMDPEPYFHAYGIRTDTPVMRKLAAALDKVEPLRANSHCITGPIEIEGARPGDVLEIRILELELTEPFGSMFVMPGAGALPDRISRPICQRVLYNDERTQAELFGFPIPLDPFMGVMAVTDTEDRPSGPPGIFGGNLDLKRLTMGTSLYLPVLVPGAMFCCGDPHAAQGNGEVGITAIETCGMMSRLQFILHKGVSLESPQAETPTHYIVTGLDRDLNEAMRKAVLHAAQFLRERNGLSFEQAVMLSSASVDFEISQFVDGVVGIHGMIPKTVVRKGSASFWNEDGSVSYAGKRF